MGKVNIIEKAIARISPKTALNREINRKKLEFINSGYSHHGANTTKKSMIGWDSTSLSPDKDINDNINILRQRSRDLYMGGAPITTGAINTVVTNVIGSGLVLRPQVDAKFLKFSDTKAEEWKLNVTRQFDYWANSKNCDKFRMNNFYELQQLAFLSHLLSGDVFVLLPYKSRQNFLYQLTIQLVEADRIATPLDLIGSKNINQGVEIKDGEVNAYYILNNHPGSFNFDNSYKKVEAYGRNTGRRNVLHLMYSERPEQTRGVPYLAPVMESLKQLGRYSTAELTSAVISAMFTVFVKSESAEGVPGEGFPEHQTIDKDDPFSYELGNGTVVNLDMNESIEIADPKRPNPNFDGFVTAIIRQIGAGLDIPYEVLIKHFSSSYSASRAAILEAWKMFKKRRNWLANNFCQPIYEEFLIEAVSKGYVEAPGFFDSPIIRAAYSKAEWHGPSQGQLDPKKEVQAAKMRVEEGFSTREKESAELNGTEYNANHRQLIKEEKMRLEIKQISENMKGGD